MTRFDTVEAILAPYDPRLGLWARGGRKFTQGDKVPSVGMAVTYAVRLHAPTHKPARYLWVQDGVITNPMAHQPISDASVFDAWGRYLGCGGSPLDPPGMPPPALVVDTDKVPGAPWIDEGEGEGEGVRAVRPEEVPPPAKAEGVSPKLIHSFRLRPDLEIQLLLPRDLTEEDVGRLCAFLRVLPFKET